MKDLRRPPRQQPSVRFGQYLTRLREQNTELSQAEAARQLDLRPQQLNYYEKGSRVPSDPLLMRVAHLYHVPTAEVLEKAYWPQLIILPLIAIIDPDQLSRDHIEELEKGLDKAERQELTQYIEELLTKRSTLNRC